jgi:8-oxo-dGTP pyrophosphatase MutT (NUDIX family)
MSKSESQAWLVAHRGTEDPAVLYIDATRARQAGTQFQLNQRGLWQVPSVPVKHVLNLRPGFAHQYSAGGFPVFYGPKGPEIALIKVRRRFGTTWEIAKGKLEPGEGPVQCAKRELQEEMGAEMDLTLEQDFGFVRFGFLTPDREPRLKTMFVYQFRCAERVENFSPAVGESVEDVGWFSPGQADQVVTHRSLRPLMRRLIQSLGR